MDIIKILIFIIIEVLFPIHTSERFMDSAESKAPTYHLYGFQVSGKAPKLATADNKIVLKCYIK